MLPSLDDLRRLRPDLSLAIYAMTPGGVVTLEVHHDGQVYTFVAPTESEAILAAFPAAPEQSEPETSPPPDRSIFD